MLKILPGSLVSCWMDLPDYVPSDCDVRIEWGELYCLPIAERRKREWRPYGLVRVIEVADIHHEPVYAGDYSFKSADYPVVQFETPDQAMIWKLTFLGT